MHLRAVVWDRPNILDDDKWELLATERVTIDLVVESTVMW